MLKIYSDLPQPVMNALLEHDGFEFTDKKNADITILTSELPPAPYKLGVLLDYISAQSNLVKICGISFDFNGKTAAALGKKTKISDKECAIIQFLHSSKQPVAKELLLEKLWNYAANATTNTVETHIYRLRQKLAENFGSEVIDTINGEYFIKT